MKIRTEDVDGRIQDTIEAWRTARTHCVNIGDADGRSAAERVADQLRDDNLRLCLSPLFRAAMKGKNGKNGKSAKDGKKNKPK
jgi:hypothetical protein